MSNVVINNVAPTEDGDNLRLNFENIVQTLHEMNDTIINLETEIKRLELLIT